MPRYRCLDCGCEFDEADGLIFHREVHTELDGCPSEMIGELRCPCCGADWESLKEEVENDA